ncbi:DUF2711 family protein [Occallatibacter riparius]|uniref:DUF2711 family protein n=1 Tax=Occallatibacter riparius TaxID=1002689 RepID=A0A9J7BT41_9BACT|nr:DUF2711 family protein [Occallatibacter riparius]UWZ84070.1 DUF2711 family protein [Occallatibacter riparius]
MQFEQFVYPNQELPLLDAYDRHFEAVYVLLHPFVCVPDEMAWKVTRQYPTEDQILSAGAKCNWSHVAAKLGVSNCARLNQALLTATGSLVDYLCDFPARDALQRFLQAEPIWMPGQGAFEPLLQSDFLAAFEDLVYEELIFVPEFPRADPVERLRIDDLRARSVPFPGCGSLVAPDASFLFTVDWDSFFTLFYGPRALIQNFAGARKLEGFFAAPTTEHSWFNYTMGCATVTVSPEDWYQNG